LWAGVSPEFLDPDVISANATKSWKEVYSPTIGLANVTDASEQIIADFKINTNSYPTASLDLFSTIPSEELNATIEITGDNQHLLLDSTITADPVSGNRLMVNFPSEPNWNVTDTLVFEIIGPNNETFLTGFITPLPDGTTDLASDKNLIPESIALYQNYPNPFNPSTTIRYSISNIEHVELKVFDSLGEEVATLVDREMPAGIYTVEFNAQSAAGGLASGVYFYRLAAGSLSEISKMILLR
jgi:hypothetical protein